ncbi:MAG: gliding motility protein GldM [Flavobacteriaceae bacterium]|nr:gliding motility protein GldM [Flavobacteriaceae bacterium]
MAGGKMSPRQKMINLMYLVFIAMLAMNMSKQVLSAFGFMNKKITDTNSKNITKVDATYTNLKVKAVEQPEKFSSKNKQAQEIKKVSDEVYAYIESMKTELTKEVEDKSDYESMDGTDKGNTYFFAGDKNSKKGDEFLANLAKIKAAYNKVLGKEYKGIVASVNDRFDTSDQKIGKKGNQPWLRNRYEEFPLITTVTNLSVIQADIKTSETEMLSAMIQGQLESDVSMRNYNAILIPNTPATLQGENFQGKIVLGRYDDKLVPTKVIINGREITNIKDGGAILDFPAGNVGENPIKGKFIFMENGEPVEIPIETTYAVVAKPNAAVISADKMNVVYRGVQNPMTISVPGVADNAVKASAPGLKKTKGIGKYMMSPGKGREVKIVVNAKLPDGTPISSSQMFRIKDIPAPVAAVRGEHGMIKMPKSTLQKATISSLLPDFVFDLKIKTTGFSVKIPGQPTVKVKGNKFDAAAIRVLNKARRGDAVIIFDVKQKLVGNSGYYLKNASPVNVEITN